MTFDFKKAPRIQDKEGIKEVYGQKEEKCQTDSRILYRNFSLTAKEITAHIWVAEDSCDVLIEGDIQGNQPPRFKASEASVFTITVLDAPKGNDGYTKVTGRCDVPNDGRKQQGKCSWEFKILTVN